MTYDIWPFWWGGLAIAGVAILVLVVGGQFVAVTRGYASMCSIISQKSYFHRPDMGGPFGFRTMFVIGIIAGGAAAALLSGSFHAGFELGMFDKIWGTNVAVKAGVLIVGGFLWGYGSRMAKGCTSGNAISGLSRGSPASLVATACFLIGGVMVTQLVMLIVGGH
ncbi:MAG: YeeE/YedE family protein [Spirochaetia bacterium]|nr:YeeE/YedE family protein [Spirochaetia bacterium]